jgi:hypothetical protein
MASLVALFAACPLQNWLWAVTLHGGLLEARRLSLRAALPRLRWSAQQPDWSQLGTA